MSPEENIKRAAFQSAKDYMRAQGREHRIAEMTTEEFNLFEYVYEVNKAKKIALAKVELRIAKLN